METHDEGSTHVVGMLTSSCGPVAASTRAALASESSEAGGGGGGEEGVEVVSPGSAEARP